jgi:hypothetical protein
MREKGTPMKTIRWCEGLPEICIGIAFGLILSIFIGREQPMPETVIVKKPVVSHKWTSEIYVGALVKTMQEEDVVILMFTTLSHSDTLDTFLIGNAKQSDFHIGETYTVVLHEGIVKYVFFGEPSGHDFLDLEMVYDN